MPAVRPRLAPVRGAVAQVLPPVPQVYMADAATGPADPAGGGIMNSADIAKRRLQAILPRCVDCRVHRVAEAGMVCLYCQRLRDNIRRSADERAAFISLHGQSMYEAERKMKEMF